MKNNAFVFEDAVFSYFLSKDKNVLFEKHLEFPFHHLILSYSKNTDVIVKQCNGEAIFIIGFCVDSQGEVSREDIPDFLLENGDGKIDSILHLSERLAGKYVIIYANAKSVYLFGDSICSLPIYYDLNGSCVSCYDTLIAKFSGYEVSKRALDVRLNSDFFQPLPYDMTLYDEIKCLLPNHYLDLINKKVFRFAPKSLPKKTDEREIDEIINHTVHLIENIVDEYLKYYEVVCPLSGGLDSRFVLAFLKKRASEISTFTFKHKDMTEETADLYIPKLITSQLGIKHFVLDDITAPGEYVRGVESIMGEYISPKLLNMAYTYNSTFKGKAVTYGDIIGQVGKSSMGGALSTFFASTSFFVAKQHNYSRYAREETRRFIEEVKASGLYDYIYDLFAIENRCGRWVAQREQAFSVCSITSLNIVNCRKIIEMWMQIPRSLRNKRVIHRYVFSKLAPELLSIPINPDSKFTWIYQNSLAFLMATYFKYYTNMVKHKLGKM